MRSLALEHVSFAYPGCEPVLADISLSIIRGMIVEEGSHEELMRLDRKSAAMFWL